MSCLQKNQAIVYVAPLKMDDFYARCGLAYL